MNFPEMSDMLVASIGLSMGDAMVAIILIVSTVVGYGMFRVFVRKL